MPAEAGAWAAVAAGAETPEVFLMKYLTLSFFGACAASIYLVGHADGDAVQWISYCFAWGFGLAGSVLGLVAMVRGA